tara:strand:+ start:27817 stop:28785 length:969 start_codon:yes stop_codon:yes gene_type:complete
MAIYKHVSGKEIIRKVFRDIRPSNANFIHDAVEWMGEALEHIGASTQLCRKQCLIDIEDHKGCLPADLYYINQVAVNTCVQSSVSNETAEISKQINELNANLSTYYSNVNSTVAKNESGQYISSLTTTDLNEFDSYHKTTLNQLNVLNSRMSVLENIYFSTNGSCLQPLQYGTSTFHSSIHCEGCVNSQVSYKETYIINCGNIQTSFAQGQICLSYMAFPVDEECYPMVPDDISYREAMFWYILKKLLLQGETFKNTKIEYQFAEMMWQKYCTQARNAANYPDIDRYQSFMDQWVRLLPNINRDLNFFEDLNSREMLQSENF